MGTKEHILNIAESLFNANGYTAVGVDLIRDTAGVSKTSMYRHFGSKNKLILAVLVRRHLRFEDKLGGVISSEMSMEQKLDALIDWHFKWFSAEDFHGCMFMHAMAEFKESDDAIADSASMHKKWFKWLIKEIISNNPDYDEQLTESKAESIMTFIEGMIVRAEFDDITSFRPIYRFSIQTLSKTEF
ncbi:TetR family transcriptional regulator [Shewanella algicola]|uniref:TetR/AcrR family transcriptional regulator n=1 Tax=Shewanella algicola TaxID=640633 RepID=A0A9X1Z7T5_9GAMM|nr:TetR/AcrR family transcriptional regulator [Shewanella algicola]MCL1107298.1 TetR/AcrR family transcriptional regulator [Shewanella algicola]GGP67192.1 TetR family transcriptional regulator [Shewanella algicola]